MGLDGIHIWEADTGQSLRTVQIGSMSRFAVSPDGKTVVSAGAGGMRVSDLTSGQDFRTLVAHEGTVERIEWSPDGKAFASAGADHTVRLWAGTVDALLRQVQHDIRLFAPSKPECRLYFGSDSCSVIH
jgi:WD40 repeat protein